jgi:hypothetical protein
MFEIALLRWAYLIKKKATMLQFEKQCYYFSASPHRLFSCASSVILGHPPFCVYLEYNIKVALGLHGLGQGR